MTWLWVMSFGVLGVSSRFAIDLFVAKWNFTFPVGTLFINIFGCFIAGLCFSYGLPKPLAENPIRLAIIVGFCGGFTTFSGYGIQIIQLLTTDRLVVALLYGVATPLLCTVATAGGFFLSDIVR